MLRDVIAYLANTVLDAICSQFDLYLQRVEFALLFLCSVAWDAVLKQSLFRKAFVSMVFLKSTCLMEETLLKINFVQQNFSFQLVTCFKSRYSSGTANDLLCAEQTHTELALHESCVCCQPDTCVKWQTAQQLLCQSCLTCHMWYATFTRTLHKRHHNADNL